jgi:hypothetical protein
MLVKKESTRLGLVVKQFRKLEIMIEKRLHGLIGS